MDKPPYSINTKILNLISSISEKVGEIRSAHLTLPPLELRKLNRIKSIQSSLQIEGNSFTEEQVTDLINGKRVIAPKKDIIEVQNAIKLYAMLDELDTHNLGSLLKAHGVLMADLVDSPGKFRTQQVGVFSGEKAVHIAPQAKMVTRLMANLFQYLNADDDHILIKSCVFHYEFEFIHPFPDGNGRIGRLWQTLILREYSPVFLHVPTEKLIKEKQLQYYNVLAACNSAGNSTLFIEYMLGIIEQNLEDLLSTQNRAVEPEDRIEQFHLVIGTRSFTRKEYLRHNKDISGPTATRDLRQAVDDGLLEVTGKLRNTRYRFLKK